MVKKFPLVFALLFAFAGCDQADYDAGVAAYERGDFKTALREFNLAAAGGNASAMFRLGSMYHKGEGVPPDNGCAYVWYSQAATRDDTTDAPWEDSTAAAITEVLETLMSPAEILRARRMTMAWTPGGKACRPR